MIQMADRPIYSRYATADGGCYWFVLRNRADYHRAFVDGVQAVQPLGSGIEEDWLAARKRARAVAGAYGIYIDSKRAAWYYLRVLRDSRRKVTRPPVEAHIAAVFGISHLGGGSYFWFTFARLDEFRAGLKDRSAVPLHHGHASMHAAAVRAAKFLAGPACRKVRDKYADYFHVRFIAAHPDQKPASSTRRPKPAAARRLEAAPMLAALHLPMGCSADDIRNAYRRIAKTAHPDRGGSCDDFVRLTMAYRGAMQLTQQLAH